MSGEGVALRYISLLQEFSRILSAELIGCLIAIAASKKKAYRTKSPVTNLRSLKSGIKRKGETLSTMLTLDKL